MLQMDFPLFNVEIICGFRSNFVATCSAKAHPFEFTPISKLPPLDILKYIVTTLSNQDKKVEFIRVDEDVEPARSSKFTKKCHEMNIIVQSKGGYASSINGKSEITNKTLANITRALPINSSNEKEIC